jgi:hypothetical protein
MNRALAFAKERACDRNAVAANRLIQSKQEEPELCAKKLVGWPFLSYS